MQRLKQNIMDIVGKGKNHQDFAPIVGNIGIRMIHGDINLKIAKTPHFVHIMTYSAIFQLVDVNPFGKRFHFVNTVQKMGDGRTMLTQLGVKESALTAWSMVT